MLDKTLNGKEEIKVIQFPNSLKQVRFLLQVDGLRAFDSDNFDEANRIMSSLVKNTLGEEAIKSLNISNDLQKEEIRKCFLNAALEVANRFSLSMDRNGNYIKEKENEFWQACDQEGPVAKKYLMIVLDNLSTNCNPDRIHNVINRVYVEDAIKLATRTLGTNRVFDKEKTESLENELSMMCKNIKQTKDVLAKVVPTSDYYYDRIYREEKINDESILKFNQGEAHGNDDLRIIDLATRLANATWLVAQRHCAKKDGKTDRIDPSKRGGVFNTPDYRHIQQYKEAIDLGLSDKEAVMRVVFELVKDGWMLED
jgi:hypothetical protein